jgi:hypothetical protein
MLVTIVSFGVRPGFALGRSCLLCNRVLYVSRSGSLLLYLNIKHAIARS